ncbi:tetratricopeptide repeat protein [Pseudanabaena sp. 'Roaring Creek']|uniref:tetratricopeptide repeat protein n=1 Tax=Pseudanabaena sp. 'Roaring Creek' TaxID=1681830 RepID=UPI000A6F362D|nr:tetratricopeptide repeat protein [Pseudanabaena sp. 'Roaring Creek']
MSFITQERLISGFGVLFLCASSPMASLAKASELSSNIKMGGIPTICHLQRLKTITDPTKQVSILALQVRRYRLANQDRLILQLVNGMDKKQFPEIQAEELIQFAYHYLEVKEPEKAVSVLNQAFQLLQNDLSSIIDNEQYRLQTLFFYREKYDLLASLGMLFIEAKQPELAEASLLQGLNIKQQKLNESPRDNVEYMVKIAQGLFALGKQEQAIALLDKSLEVIQSLKKSNSGRDRQEWLILLNNLSWEYRAIGKVIKADQLFSQSLDYANSFSNPVSKVWWLSIIAERTYFPPSESNSTDERQAKLKQIFGKILQTVRSNQSTEMTKFITYALAAEWLQFSGVESAMQIVNTVADPVERFKVVSPILENIRSENANKDIDLLVPLLQEAESIARTIPSNTDRDQAWSVIANTYAKLGQSQTALQKIDLIQSMEQKQQALIDVADNLARNLQPDLALSLVRDLPNNLVQQVLYDSMLSYLKNGKLETALSLQGRLSQDYQKFTLTNLAEASAKAGRTTQALKLLQQITETRWRSETLISIVNQSLNVGDLDRALVFAQQMPQSSEVDISSKSLFALEEIAIAYAESGQYDKAIQVSLSLQDPSISQLAICAKRSP